MVADLADFYDDKQSNAEMQKYREAQEDLDRKHLPLFVSMDINSLLMGAVYFQILFKPDYMIDWLLSNIP